MKSKTKLLKLALFLGDFLLMYFSILLALAVRYNDFSFLPGSQTKIFLFYFSFIQLIWIFILYLLDFYEIPPLRNLTKFFSHLVIFLSLAFIIGGIYFYFQPKAVITPKTILLIDILFLGIFLYLWRLFFSFLLEVFHFKEKIFFFGDHPLLKEIYPEVLVRKEYEILDNLEEKPDLIILSFSRENKKEFEREIPKLLLNSRYLTAEEFYEIIFRKISLDYVDQDWLLKNFKNKGAIYVIAKRLFDITFSFLGLFLMIILFPFIALGIKLTSPGPIFYKQKRIGRNGKVFSLYKFRTMIKDADKKGPHWTVKNDSRITKFGKFLRRTHLDEIPQFFNILKGDISFVGFRPEAAELSEKYRKEIPFYEIRHIVKPGLTGWAQINYKASASVEEAKEKLEYELYYLKHRSFILDLGIILKTIGHLF